MTVDDPVMAPELAIRPRKVQHRILIVDDDHSQTEVLAYRFDKLGYKTVTANNGTDGLQIARDEHPDLILLDIRLPDIDGLSVCHELNDSADTCDIPIIVLSAMERPDIIRRTRSAGSHFFSPQAVRPQCVIDVGRSRD